MVITLCCRRTRLEPWLQPPTPPGWTGMSTASQANALVVEREQVSAARFQNSVENPPRRVEGVIAEDHGFVMRCSTIAHGCNVQVSTYFWSCWVIGGETSATLLYQNSQFHKSSCWHFQYKQKKMSLVPFSLCSNMTFSWQIALSLIGTECATMHFIRRSSRQFLQNKPSYRRCTRIFSK